MPARRGRSSFASGGSCGAFRTSDGRGGRNEFEFRARCFLSREEVIQCLTVESSLARQGQAVASAVPARERVRCRHRSSNDDRCASGSRSREAPRRVRSNQRPRAPRGPRPLCLPVPVTRGSGTRRVTAGGQIVALHSRRQATMTPTASVADPQRMIDSMACSVAARPASRSRVVVSTS